MSTRKSTSQYMVTPNSDPESRGRFKNGGCIFHPFLFSPRIGLTGYYDLRGFCYTPHLCHHKTRTQDPGPARPRRR